MKKVILILFISVLLIGCNKQYKYTEGVIIRKEIIKTNYYFIMEYKIENIEGYNAMINVSKDDYNKYDLNDLYKFKRPTKKE